VRTGGRGDHKKEGGKGPRRVVPRPAEAGSRARIPHQGRDRAAQGRHSPEIAD
jgi:hypothetical protein